MTMTITRRQLSPTVAAVSVSLNRNRHIDIDEHDCSSSFHYLFRFHKKSATKAHLMFKIQIYWHGVWDGHKSFSHWTLQSTCDALPRAHTPTHSHMRLWLSWVHLLHKKWSNHIIGQIIWKIWWMRAATKKTYRGHWHQNGDGHPIRIHTHGNYEWFLFRSVCASRCRLVSSTIECVKNH